MQNKMDDRSETYRIKLSLSRKNDARILASELVPANSLVLDVGCACGDFGVLLKENLMCSMYGMEYNKSSIEIAQETRAYSKIHQVDLEQFDPEAFKCYFGYFDCIVILDVLEHLRQPEETLDLLLAYLKPDGFFVISLPNIAFCEVKAALLNDEFEYTEMGIMDRTHLKFFTHKSISNFFSNLGLLITEYRITVKDWSDVASKLSFSLKMAIGQNPHSFVYQYICKVSRQKDSNRSTVEAENSKKLAMTWRDVSPVLKDIRRGKFIAKWFPRNSLRFWLAKSLQSVFANHKTARSS